MATVERGENGELVLIDPEGYAVAVAVSKHNCRLTLDANAERVKHFRQRAVELEKSPDEVVIVIANVDDRHGQELASVLMPDFDWQPIRDRGETPFARGLADMRAIHHFLSYMDKDASDKLSNFGGMAVVVVDHGVAEVF